MSEGLNEILFHLLWTKDKVFDSVVKVFIPNTIIYQYYHPCFWYFTSIEGSIKRKSKDKLADSYIKHEFLKRVSPSGIVALLFYMEESKRIIEYLTVEKFISFVDGRKIHKDMILQKFVDPAGDFNITYSVLWTTNFCLFEKRQNKLNLYNEKFDLYERAVTFEGKDYHSVNTPIRGTMLPNRLMKTADSIVSHVAAVTFEKMRIIRMVLQVKLDSEERLWMVCATSLRFFNDSARVPMELNKNFDLPKELNIKNLTVDHRSPAFFLKNKKCASCMCDFEPTKVIELTYDEIFKMLKDDPVPIYNLHPKVSKEDIAKLRESENFYKLKAWMCANCYLKFAECSDSCGKQISLPAVKRENSKSNRIKKGISQRILTTSKLSSIEMASSRSSIAQLVLPSHTTFMSSNLHTFSTRTSKTAGGEVFISFPTPKAGFLS